MRLLKCKFYDFHYRFSERGAYQCRLSLASNNTITAGVIDSTCEKKKKRVVSNATSLAILQRILAQVKWDIRLDFFYICHIVTLSNEVGVILWERKGILMEEFNSEVYLFWIFHLPKRRLLTEVNCNSCPENLLHTFNWCESAFVFNDSDWSILHCIG